MTSSNQPQRVRKEFSQDEQQGYKAKTIAGGGKGGGGQGSGILEQIQGLDDNKSGAIKPAIQKLKKLKDLQEMTDGSGMNGMLGQMMSQAMKAAMGGGGKGGGGGGGSSGGGAGGGVQVASQIAAAIDGAEDLPGDLRDAMVQTIVDMVDSVNGHTGILFLLNRMRDACEDILGIIRQGQNLTPPPSPFGPIETIPPATEDVVGDLHVIAECGRDIIRLDTSFLNETQVSSM